MREPKDLINPRALCVAVRNSNAASGLATLVYRLPDDMPADAVLATVVLDGSLHVRVHSLSDPTVETCLATYAPGTWVLFHWMTEEAYCELVTVTRH